MKRIIASIYLYLILSILILVIAIALQSANKQIDLLSKAGSLISLLASIFLFHRLFSSGLAEAAKNEIDIDCGEYDGSSIEKHLSDGKRIILNDYWGIILMVFGSLLGIFGDIIKSRFWPN